MTRQTETVWRSSLGDKLLSQSEPDKFMVHASTCTQAELRELKSAIDDALQEPMIREMRDVEKRENGRKKAPDPQF